MKPEPRKSRKETQTGVEIDAQEAMRKLTCWGCQWEAGGPREGRALPAYCTTALAAGWGMGFGEELEA